MTILGISLQTPSRPRLIRLLAALIAGALLVWALSAMGTPNEFARAIFIGIAGGGAACAFGVELPRDGWRGVAVSIAFWLLLVVVAFGVSLLD